MALGDRAGVVDVLAGAAGALAMGRRAMVVELQRDADHVVALRLEQRRGHRGIDAAGHGDDDTGVLRTAFEIETVGHGASVITSRGLGLRQPSRPAITTITICPAHPGAMSAPIDLAGEAPAIACRSRVRDPSP